MTATQDPTTSPHIDLLQDTWAERIPHEELAWLRANAPVYKHPGPEAGEDFWAVTKWDDVRAASRDAGLWSVEIGSPFIETHDEESLQIMAMTLVSMDPPKHTRMRKLVSAGFTPRMIRMLHDAMKVRATHIVDEVIADGKCDFVEKIAAELPLQVICEMIGVPEEDRHKVFAWSNTMVGQEDPEYASDDPEGAGMQAMTEMFLYCDNIAAQRRENPRDDVMTILVNAEVDGERLTEAELDMFFVILAVAGNETTRNLIAHAMLALFEHPDAMDELRTNLDDEELWKVATEEFLRWGSSIINFRRTATRDTEIRGVPIKKGEKAVLYYISANRDEDVFDDPFTFDIHRTPNDHVTFGGGGIHYCLGANLAKLEIRVMLQEVLRRMPDIALDGVPQRLRSKFVNGIKHMQVTWTPPGS